MNPNLGPPYGLMGHDGPKLAQGLSGPKLGPPMGHGGPKLAQGPHFGPPPVGHDGTKLAQGPLWVQFPPPPMAHDGPKLAQGPLWAQPWAFHGP
jgi:hypothetical protein